MTGVSHQCPARNSLIFKAHFEENKGKHAFNIIRIPSDA
jgi:hypothetical protein